jgi:predicted alpha/beta-hydrolase family hydrolase
LLALSCIKTNELKPAACLIMGLPIRFADKLSISLVNLLKCVNIPTLIVQNENDPAGSYDDVVRLIRSAGNNNVSAEKLPGDNHDYGDFVKLRRLLSALSK